MFNVVLISYEVSHPIRLVGLDSPHCLSPNNYSLYTIIYVVLIILYELRNVIIVVWKILKGLNSVLSTAIVTHFEKSTC
jgi:hypothetical protein